MKNKLKNMFPVRKGQEFSTMEHTAMNSSSTSVRLLFRLALGLSLLAWMVVAGGTSLSIFSSRAVSASVGALSGEQATKRVSVMPFKQFVGPGTPAFASLAASSMGGFVQQGRVLRVLPSAVPPGGSFTLPVDFYAQGDEHAVQFSLRFDARLLSLIGAEAGADAAGAQVNLDYSRSSEGLLGVSIVLAPGASFEAGNNRVLNLSMSAPEGRVRRTASVEFADEPVARATVDVTSRSLVTSYAAGSVAVAAAIEADVAPRPNGSEDGALTIGDWIQAGRFVAHLDTAENGSEFQRADSAPRSTSGNGAITLSDWVQAGRYSEGLDPAQPAAGPTSPVSFGEANATEGGAVASGTAEQAQFHVVRATDATFTRGQDNSHSIELDAQGDENAVGFTLNYNPSHMTFVRAVLGNGVPSGANPILNVNTSELGVGRVGIVLGLRANSNFGVGNKQLLVITFSVPLNGNQNSTTVSFGDLPVGRSVVNTNADAVTSTFNPANINFNPTVNAIPVLSTISPNFVIVGGPTFTLIVNGSDFVDGASVRVDGQERATRFVSSTELQAFIPPTDIDETAILNITVANPPPGGGVSLPLTLSVNNPIPSVSGVTPGVIGVNSGSQSINVSGTNFVTGAIVRWNGQNRQTFFVNSGLLTASILATDVNTVGTPTITVQNPGPGGGLSNGVNVSVITASPIPRISSLEPATWATQGGPFALKVIGQNFAQNAIVRWGGSPRPTIFVSSTELQAQISGSDVASEGTVNISVVNPPPGGGNSNNVPFVISGQPNPVPVLNSISPDNVTSGGSDFNLTASGSNFISTSVVQVNGQNRPTTFVSSGQLQATVFAADIAAGGVAEIKVFTPLPGGGSSQTLNLTIGQGSPTIVFLSPNSALVGGNGFSLNVIGNSFTSNSVVRWNGSPRTTTFISGTELHADILATDISTVGSATVTVFSPPPGGGASNAATFSIVQSDNPLPRVNSISPTQVTAGSPAFTLTVNGTGYFAGSLVRWNGSPRQTTFVSPTQLTAQITAADVATIGTNAITVFNSAPGGGVSNSLSLAVTSAAGLPPVITNITPTTVNAGGQGFTLAVEGANFTPTSVVQFNSDTRPTTFISANQLTALISEADLQFGGEVTINVFNPPPGAGTSNVATLTILNPAPVLSSASPTKLGQGTSGNTPVVITGSNFNSGVVVQVNGANRPTTRNSSTQVTVQISQADKLNLGFLTLIATNPSPGGGASNAIQIEVAPLNFLPRLVSISPDAANAGSPGLTLVLTGSNFAQNAVVRWANRDLPTEFLSTTTLLATVTAADLQLGGFVPVRVFNPEPGGGTSSAVNFAINSPAPTITNVNPNPIVGTSQSAVITVDGSNFVGSSVVRFNGAARPTTFLSTNQLAATLPATDLVGITSATISVFSPEPGGGTSNSLTVSVTPGVAGEPQITSLNPGAVIVGSAGFTLTVNGNNLFPSSTVFFNGSPRQTAYVSANQLTASISASDVANIGTASITVFTPAPGGGTSNSFNFGIIASPPGPPSLSSLSPNSVGIGTPFALTVNGANFAQTSIVLVNGSARLTSYVSGSQLIAQITAADVASQGNLSISVFTPAPGGGTSNSLTLSVNATTNPTPTVLSLNPVSATAGGPAFTLTVNGANFVGGSVVRWNGINQATVFVNSTQLTASIPASNIISQGTVEVTVFNPPAGGGLSNSVIFGINPAGPPPTCNTICLKSARYYERNTNRLPNGLVLIGGFNANSAIQIQSNIVKIKDTLQGGESGLAQLNKQFLAIQLSLILSGSGSVGGLQSSPSCYGVSFPAVLLSNGVTLTPASTTNDILGQVRGAIFESRASDMPALANILALMNGDDPSSICNRITSGSSAAPPAFDQEAVPAVLRRDAEGRWFR